ncbi:MAG: hypothetical protein IKW21_04320 [Lachnospiraceae bacterium]|nr:hypothetical protein [Lachnospiraceae bacterium]
MKNEYLSVKEFADAVGISQQAVYKQLNNRLKPYLKVVNNKKMLDLSALELFKKEDKEDNQDQNNNQLLNQLLNQLQKELDEKGQQLKEKDKQIERLQQALDQAQKLNAMDKQKILELEDKMAAADQDPDPEPEKKKWWNWFS